MRAEREFRLGVSVLQGLAVLWEYWGNFGVTSPCRQTSSHQFSLCFHLPTVPFLSNHTGWAVLVWAGSWWILCLCLSDHPDTWPLAWWSVRATIWALFREENHRKRKGRKGRKLSPCGGGKQSKPNLTLLHYLVMWFHRSLNKARRSGRFECSLLLNISSFVLSGLGWPPSICSCWLYLPSSDTSKCFIKLALPVSVGWKKLHRV